MIGPKNSFQHGGEDCILNTRHFPFVFSLEGPGNHVHRHNDRTIIKRARDIFNRGSETLRKTWRLLTEGKCPLGPAYNVDKNISCEVTERGTIIGFILRICPEFSMLENRG